MAHFVFALGFGRVMEFLFWIYSHHELERIKITWILGPVFSNNSNPYDDKLSPWILCGNEEFHSHDATDK